MSSTTPTVPPPGAAPTTPAAPATPTTPAVGGPPWYVMVPVVVIIIFCVILVLFGGKGCNSGKSDKSYEVEIIAYERIVKDGKTLLNPLSRGFATKKAAFTFTITDATKLRFESDAALKIQWPERDDPTRHFTDWYCGSGPITPSQPVGFGVIYFFKANKNVPCE